MARQAAGSDSGRRDCRPGPDPATALVGPRARYAKRPRGGRFAYLAEREGFEPSVGYKPTPDFESGTFNRSATSPEAGHA